MSPYRENAREVATPKPPIDWRTRWMLALSTTLALVLALLALLARDAADLVKPPPRVITIPSRPFVVDGVKIGEMWSAADAITTDTAPIWAVLAGDGGVTFVSQGYADASAR